MDRLSIDAQVARIVQSPLLSRKSQLRRLLEVLAGHIDDQAELTSTRVIREVWADRAGQKEAADLASAINRLRHVLEEYYRTEGEQDACLIWLPRRTAPSAAQGRENRWIEARLREPESETEPEARPMKPDPASEAKPVSAVALFEQPAGTGGRRDRSYRVPFFLLLTGVLCFAAIQLVLWTIQDRAPYSSRLDGTEFVVVNASGAELWRKSFPEGFLPGFYEDGLPIRSWIGDLNGDGRTEVLLLYHPASNPLVKSTRLICFSARGNELWSWTTGRKLPEVARSPAGFKTAGFAVIGQAGSRQKRIVVSSSHQYEYPHQVAVLDGQGQVQSEYWHSGHLDFLSITDMDGDGRQEIVLSGISNGYNQATMVVLDPAQANGASIELARPELQLHGLGQAHEKLRVLFPRSDLNQRLGVYNIGGEVSIVDGYTRTQVVECQLHRGCEISYQFNPRFELVRVEPDDGFLSSHKEFFAKTPADHEFSQAEAEALRRVRCLSGCTTDYAPYVGN